MFYSLTGNIVFADLSSVAIDCSGVAYRCFTSLNTLKKIGNVGQRATLYTYLSVREDAMELYGFADNEELDFFKLLIGVSGVGPKAAVAVLSEHTPENLARSISSGDLKAITRAQGIGPKIAQRIILELKDKINKRIAATPGFAVTGENMSDTAPGNASEAIAALTALGFSQTDASQTVGKLDGTLSVEELIRLSLKYLSRG